MKKSVAPGLLKSIGIWKTSNKALWRSFGTKTIKLSSQRRNAERDDGRH